MPGIPVDWQHVENTIIGEGANQKLQGMTAIAEVMRNRGWNLKGFVASRRVDLRQFVARQPAYVRHNAHKAVEAAKAGSNTVFGATHYENVEAFGLPKWAKGKTALAKIGAHTFWRL